MSTLIFGIRMKYPLQLQKNDTYSEKMTAKNRNANLTREEQKSINSMFKDSLTFD
jgi:hypothetical protein